jgi:hypothetical protein
MNDVELEQRPKKKRRFFVDDSPPSTPLDAASDDDSQPRTDVPSPAVQPSTSEPTFDVEVLSSFLGERLSAPVVAILSKLSQNNLERGICHHTERDHSLTGLQL